MNKVEMCICLEKITPSLSNSYIEHMKKKCILSRFAIYNPSTDPTK